MEGHQHVARISDPPREVTEPDRRVERDRRPSGAGRLDPTFDWSGGFGRTTSRVQSGGSPSGFEVRHPMSSSRSTREISPRRSTHHTWNLFNDVRFVGCWAGRGREGRGEERDELLTSVSDPASASPGVTVSTDRVSGSRLSALGALKGTTTSWEGVRRPSSQGRLEGNRTEDGTSILEGGWKVTRGTLSVRTEPGPLRSGRRQGPPKGRRWSRQTRATATGRSVHSEDRHNSAKGRVTGEGPRRQPPRRRSDWLQTGHGRPDSRFSEGDREDSQLAEGDRKSVV